MLRLLAALALALGAAGWLAFLTVLGEGPFARPAMRHLRAMKERTAAPAVVAPITIEAIRALPHGEPPARTAPIEGRGVSMEGWVQRMMWASDGDLHLEIAPAPPGAGLIRYATAEITPALRRRHPGWGYDALCDAFRPNVGGPTAWPGGPRRARIAGWLLYDFQYDLPVSDETWAHGAPRASGWEIHPVTGIEVWDEARGTWREVGP